MPSVTACLPTFSLLLPSSSRRSAAAGAVGSMRRRGPGTSLRRDRLSSYVGPPSLKCATVNRVPPSSGGSHRTVAALHPHVCFSVALSMLAAWSTRWVGSCSCRSEDPSSPPTVWGFGAARSLSVAAASHGRSGPAPRIIVGRGRVCGPHPSNWTLAYCGAGPPWRARFCAPTAPLTRPLHAHNVGLPCGHGIASDDPRREEHAPQVLRETPRHVPVRLGVLLRGTLQGAVHDAEGGHQVPTRARGRGGGSRPSAAVSHRCTRAAALWGSRRSCSSRWLRSSHTKSPSRSMCWRNSSKEAPPGGS